MTVIVAAARTLLVLIFVGVAVPASAQTPKTPPDKGFILHEEQSVDRFVVQRWVSEASPEVSPAGFCECMTTVYEGDRLILNLGLDAGITRVQSSGADITGDGLRELVVTTNSGGAHCCEATQIYSVEAKPRSILSVATGSCSGELIDLDKDKVPEFRTCDDTFGYAFCSFAFSPMPTVVFAYDRRTEMFVPATPRYARSLPNPNGPDLADARKTMAENSGEAEIVRCAALRPALSLIYLGRVDQGLRLFRQLYRGADAATIEQKAMGLVKESPLWVGR
jgi:hypothetical protein